MAFFYLLFLPSLETMLPKYGNSSKERRFFSELCSFTLYFISMISNPTYLDSIAQINVSVAYWGPILYLLLCFLFPCKVLYLSQSKVRLEIVCILVLFQITIWKDSDVCLLWRTRHLHLARELDALTFKLISFILIIESHLILSNNSLKFLLSAAKYASFSSFLKRISLFFMLLSIFHCRQYIFSIVLLSFDHY